MADDDADVIDFKTLAGVNASDFADGIFTFNP